jgi:glycosyltransferase involved in cell wall biosynthesis
MGCGIPVVASAVGMNNEIVKEGKNGFLVTTKQEWLEKLTLLIENEILRKQLGKQGRIDIETKYSNKIALQTLLSVIKDEA